MKSAFHGGDVATLKELIDYEEKTVAKKEIASNESVRLMLMAFDDDEALSPHRAPADALLTVLEGEAAVVYEEAEHKLRTGDVICFDKGGLHSVKAVGKMKMALLLMV